MNETLMERVTDKVIEKLKEKMSSFFMVEASGRHIHLSKEDLNYLLGEDAHLQPVKYLSQPGQYASQLRLTLLGPKGHLENVIVLGPTRGETQVEISMTDANLLGIKAPVRSSGDTVGTPGITIINGDRSLTLDKGVIVAKRHIHVNTKDAQNMGVKDKDIVKVEVDGTRPLIFDDVLVRVSDDFNTAMHIDYDEANACGYKKGMSGRVVKG